MELIVITQENLTEIVNKAVNDAVKSFIPKKDEPGKNLTLLEGLEFLNNNGYRMSKSQIYKYTMDNSIPFSRFGKKIIFNREELATWAASQLKNNSIDIIALSVSKNAAKKTH